MCRFVVGWCIVILPFFFTIIIIILLPQIFVRSISRSCLDQTLWNQVGISYAMWSCVFKDLFFQNGCRCHGNRQNANKLKNTKMIIAGYSPNRNWWNLGGLKHFLDSFHQTSSNFVGISTVVCGNFRGLHKFKMSGVVMVTKVQKMLNSLQTPKIFAVMFPVTSASSGTR